MGVGRYLKEKNPEIKLVGIQPDSPLHGIEGLKHMPSALKPAIYDESVLDEVIFVKTEEAYFFVKALLERLSLLLGSLLGQLLQELLK